MKLDQIMTDAGVTNAALARSIGVSEAAVSRYRTVKVRPRPAYADRIIAYFKALKIVVTYDDLYRKP